MNKIFVFCLFFCLCLSALHADEYTVSLSFVNSGDSNYDPSRLTLQKQLFHSGGGAGWENDNVDINSSVGNLNVGGTLLLNVETYAGASGNYWDSSQFRLIDVTDAGTWTSTVAGALTYGQAGGGSIQIGGPGPQYTNYTFGITNDYSVPATYKVTFDGAVVASGSLTNGEGTTYTTPDIETSPTNENCSVNIQLIPQPNIGINTTTDGNGNPSLSFTNLNGSGSSLGGSGSGGMSPTGGTNSLVGGDGGLGGMGGLNSDYAPTNTVTFPSSTGSTNGQGANNTDMEAGFQLLHGDLKNLLLGDDLINSTLTNIDLLAYGIKTNTDFIPGFADSLTNLHVTGATNQAGTNVFVDNMPTNFPDVQAEISLAQATNELAALGEITNQLNGSTNAISLNDESNLVAGLIQTQTTNATAAAAAADAAQGDYGVSGLISSLTPSLPPDSPSAPDMTMQFCGTTVDFNPVDQFPSVASASYTGFKIVFLLLFLLDVAFMFWKLLQLRASTSTGGVPDMDVFGGVQALTFGASAGGNFLGVAVGLLVPVAFIAIFATAMAYLFSNLGIDVADAMNISAFSTGLGGIGYYLLASFIPVNLLFSLLCTRITLMFTLGKLVGLASAAARFLLGK